MLSYVTLSLDLYNGQGVAETGGSAAIVPSAVLTDAGMAVIGQDPVPALFHAGSLPQVKLLATDSSGPVPTGWTWAITFSGQAAPLAGFSFELPANPTTFTATDGTPCVFTASGAAYFNGTGVQLSGGSLPAGFAASTTYYVVNLSGLTFELAATQGGSPIASTSTGSGSVVAVSQLMSNLVPVSSGTSFQAYMLLPTGTPSSRQVPVASGSGEGSAWGSLTAADVGADASGLAGTAQTNAEAFATSAVGTETARAELAEGVNATAISAETTRAEIAEGVNAAAIAAETVRAEVAEALALPLTGGSVSGALAVAGELTAAGFEVPLLGPSRLVPYRAASSIKTMFQTGHGWTTSGAGVGSSNLNDTSTFIRGTQCATVTTAGNGSQAALSLAGAAAVDLTGKMIRLTFKVDDITHLATIAFYVGTSSFGSNFLWHVFTSTPGSLNYIQSGEWITVCVSWADLYGSATYTFPNGVPSTTSGFTDMRLAVYDDGAGACTIHYQSVEIVPDTSVTFPNGLVSITFDDSYQNVYDNARPVMDTYGYAGSLMTIVDQIGQSGRLTLAELRSLKNFSGWEVAGHAYTLANHNAGYNTLTADQVNTELRNLKAWLVSNGFSGDSFAYPGGEFAATTDSVPVDQIASQYFPLGRTVISELNEVWVPPMPMRVKALTGVSSEAGGVPVSTLTAAGGVVERCAQEGAWLVIALHQVVTSGVSATTQILQSDLSSLLSSINGYGMTVLPVSSVLRNYG